MSTLKFPAVSSGSAVNVNLAPEGKKSTAEIFAVKFSGASRAEEVPCGKINSDKMKTSGKIKAFMRMSISPFNMCVLP